MPREEGNGKVAGRYASLCTPCCRNVYAFSVEGCARKSGCFWVEKLRRVREVMAVKWVREVEVVRVPTGYQPVGVAAHRPQHEGATSAWVERRAIVIGKRCWVATRARTLGGNRRFPERLAPP